jgi:hypothetical protein
MSWLEELEYTYVYLCKNTGKEVHVKCRAKEDPVPPVMDGHDFEPRGFLPQKMGGVTKVEYEHNGRKGIRITDSSGGVQHRAKSKESYLKTGKIPDDVPQSRDSIVEKQNVAAKQFMQSMTQP